MNKLFATGDVTIAARPDQVFGLVSDPVAMAAFAEETVGAQWIGGAVQSAVGARFKGYNRNGVRRWTTVCEIVDLDPGRRFAYHVSTTFKVPISRWQYDVAEGPSGTCVVTETNWLKAPLWFIPFAILITGVLNRPGKNRASIETTLNRLKAHIESAGTVTA